MYICNKLKNPHTQQSFKHMIAVWQRWVDMEDETNLSYIQNWKAIVIADIKKSKRRCLLNSKDLFHNINHQH